MKSLLIDASTSLIFVGAFEDKKWIKLLSLNSGAMEGLFELAKKLFAKIPLKNFDQVVFCEGPGRLMSLRIAAVAANQWAEAGRERFVYNSLQLASEASGKPVGIELRQGAFTAWQSGKIEIFPSLPAGVRPLDPSLYRKAAEQLPFLAEKLMKPADFFDPPLWAPLEYKKVT